MTALAETVIRWMPVSTAVSDMTQAGERETGAFGSWEDGRVLEEDIVWFL